MKDIFENVEYLTVKKNNRQLLLLEDKQINGMSRTELAKYIGEQLGEGVFNYAVKYYNDAKIKVGKITSVIDPNKKKLEPESDNKFNMFLEKINNLETKLSKNNNGSDFENILKMKDAAYQIQIDFWKNQAEMLKQENEKLKKEIENNGSNPILDALLPIIAQSITKQPG